MSTIYLGNTLITDTYVGDAKSTILKPTIPLDADAELFISAASISNDNVKLAISDFVKGLKTNGFWDDLVAIYPFVSDNSLIAETQYSYNLKNTTLHQIIFPNGLADTDLTGFKSDEVGLIYGNSNLKQRDYFSSSIYIGIYTNTLNTDDVIDRYDFGSRDLGTSLYDTYVSTGRFLDGTNTTKTFYVGSSGSASVGPATILETTSPNEAGFYQFHYKNELATINVNGTTIDTIAGTVVNTSRFNAYIGCINEGFRGIEPEEEPIQFSNKRYQMVVVGFPFDTATNEFITFYNIVQQFQQDIDAALGTNRSV